MVHVLQEEERGKGKITMAYKRYIKKNGKLYGPYIYKSIRDKNGNVKNIYVGMGKPEKQKESKFRRLGRFASRGIPAKPSPPAAPCSSCSRQA
jgi:hypothetical protein